MQHIHILGICGTFMGSLAQLAIAQGYRVTGADANVYPPMSTQLEDAGIELIEGYDESQISLAPDIFIIGNAISRGNPLLEAILDKGLSYTSGPQWLSDHVLQGKWVLAVSGTHGKTTTSSMLAWILEYAGMSPGYLIGGVPQNFSVSARLGNTPFFVIEADEYDSAFFDKRSKFVHYRPRTLVINNVEFDHADIFDNLAAIQKQFHHVVRTVPGEGMVIYPSNTPVIDEIIQQGCWSERQQFSLSNIDVEKSTLQVQTPVPQWHVELINHDGSCFKVHHQHQEFAIVQWSQLGLHSVANGVAAIAAAHHVGVTPEVACAALSEFVGVKRRMELLLNSRGVKVYDDFAHHPTAIATTLSGLRKNVDKEKIIAVIEPRSNTMRMGVHASSLAEAVNEADHVLWFDPPHLSWDLESVIVNTHVPSERCQSINDLVDRIVSLVTVDKQINNHVVIMSNGGFGGLHQRLVKQLQ